MACFPCQTCNQAFESRQSLNEHLEYTHCIGKTDEKMAKKSGNLIFIFINLDFRFETESFSVIRASFRDKY